MNMLATSPNQVCQPRPYIQYLDSDMLLFYDFFTIEISSISLVHGIPGWSTPQDNRMGASNME